MAGWVRRVRGGTVVRALLSLALVGGGAGLVGWSVLRDGEPRADPAVVAGRDVVDPDPDPTPAGTLRPVTIRALRPDRSMAAPTHVVIPSLGVDAPVVPIGVENGVLIPPGDPQTLGWWSDGAEPGAVRGGALVTGHTVHTGGGQLDDLEQVRRGDVVRVRTTKGVIPYRVSKVTIYRKATLARDAQQVFSQTGPGRLVLITCEDWDGTKYLSNVVVFAEPRPTV
ncbi:class F sortase [Nocardioides marmoribigeumensis]|uniref:LPXTG-site transpeptidase (Sortase) family protein n=1 Tax=Nocardioides marmoribigeumensis TaxID=433649 RepID=A0ABU2BSP8_9ACTN|nr:class F sortase [Nocardioides marmoribigeumensis]MDR7361659.1 LPXTG-site transpeptidase (sortase) family protein [Nocardioides marmoribigeumensis]